MEGCGSVTLIICEGTVWIEQYQTLAGNWNLRTNRPDIPLAIPPSVCVPSPSQAPSVNPANVRSEMESGQRQAQEEVPAIAADKAPSVVTQSPEAACPLLRRSSRVCKAPDRLIKTI